MKSRILFALLLAVVAPVSTPAITDFTWGGGGPNGSLLDLTNWLQGSAPLGTGGENFTFGDITGSQTTVQLPGAAFNNLIFNGSSRPAYFFSGLDGNQTVTLNGDLTMSSGANATFSSSVLLSLSNRIHAVDIAGSDTTVQIAGVISGTGGFSKSNTGTLVLGGANTYLGSTNVNSGMIVIGTTNALPVTTTLNVGSAGSVDVLHDQTVERLTSGSATTAQVILEAGQTLTIDFANAAPFGADFRGVISGAGNLRIAASPGHRAFALAGSNTYTGTTQIDAGGTLQIGLGGSTGSLGTGDVLNNGILAFSRSDDGFNYAGVISGTGQVFNNSGVSVLAGHNTLTGGVTVNGGTLMVAGEGARLASSSAPVTVNFGGMLGVLNGGVITNSVTVNFGGMLAGDGYIREATLAHGGILAPGVDLTGSRIGHLDLEELTLAGNNLLSFDVQHVGDGAFSHDSVRITTPSTTTINANASHPLTLYLISLDALGDPGQFASGLISGQTYSFTFLSSQSYAGNALVLNSNLFLDYSNFNTGFDTNLYNVNKVGNDYVLSFTPVPEPSTYALLGLGLSLSGLAAWRKRRRA